MIGDVIKANRIKKGWTQEELAGRLNVTKASVSKWELNQNSPDIGTLPALGDVFGVTMDELLEYGHGEKRPEEESVWVMNLYDTGAWARLFSFSEDMIPDLQKRMGEKDFLDIEFHVPDGKGGVEVTHRWVVKDEVLSFRGGDREACEKATVHICEKGIYAHVI